jgi:hypothetical protein
LRKFSIVITAVDRPHHARVRCEHLGIYKTIKRENYIERTVTSLMENAGLKHVGASYAKISIFDSGSYSLDYLKPVKEKYPQINIVPADKRADHDGLCDPGINLFPNTNRALEQGSTEAKYVILIQDDVIFSRNTFFEIDRWVDTLPKDFGFATLWGHHSARSGRSKAGHIKIKPLSFWGNLCLIFPSEVISTFAAHPEWNKGRGTGHDMALKCWADSNKKDILEYPFPLVDHIGFESTIGPRAKRTNSRFKGEKFLAHKNPDYRKYNKGDKFKIMGDLTEKYLLDDKKALIANFIETSEPKKILITGRATNTLFTEKDLEKYTVGFLPTDEKLAFNIRQKYDLIIYSDSYHWDVDKFGIEDADKFVAKLIKQGKTVIFDTGGPEEDRSTRIPWSKKLKEHYPTEGELLHHFNVPFAVLGTYQDKWYTRSVAAFSAIRKVKNSNE